ncbi:hypothetical protein EDC04DRAFT_1256242 [Pisolithus marmoratus]|nr:hypothetical protein EDC04DRAFT_1256242 [Pisolithus marmoratus]
MHSETGSRHFFLAAPHRDIADKQLDDMDWQILPDMEVVLEIPHSAQQCMLGKSFPLLSCAVPLFETFMTQWEPLTMNKPCFAPYIEISLWHARSYYQHMEESNAYVIVMHKFLTKTCMHSETC